MPTATFDEFDGAGLDATAKGFEYLGLRPGRPQRGHVEDGAVA